MRMHMLFGRLPLALHWRLFGLVACLALLYYAPPYSASHVPSLYGRGPSPNVMAPALLGLREKNKF